MFGTGRRVPLDGNAKARIMTRARGYRHREKDGSQKRKGRAYGALSAKALDVLWALLYTRHNARSGACFPSYETIMDDAQCCKQTVYDAIRALEALGILDWENRIERRRVRATGVDLLGGANWSIKVVRTSNAYVINDPEPSKSTFQAGTKNQVSFLKTEPPDPAVSAALSRLETSRQWMESRKRLCNG